MKNLNAKLAEAVNDISLTKIGEAKYKVNNAVVGETVTVYFRMESEAIKNPFTIYVIGGYFGSDTTAHEYHVGTDASYYGSATITLTSTDAYISWISKYDASSIGCTGITIPAEDYKYINCVEFINCTDQSCVNDIAEACIQGNRDITTYPRITCFNAGTGYYYNQAQQKILIPYTGKVYINFTVSGYNITDSNGNVVYEK